MFIVADVWRRAVGISGKAPLQTFVFFVSILRVRLIIADHEEEQYEMIEITHNWKRLNFTLEGTLWGTEFRKKLNIYVALTSLVKI